MTGRIRTTCTLCRFGCELEVVRDGRRIAGVEYPADAKTNAGRLCARGSAAALLLDHPQRLCYPLHDGRVSTWDEFAAEVGPLVRECPSNELAIGYGRNLTRDELEMIFGLANALGTELVGPLWLENGMHWSWQLDGKRRIEARAELDDVTRADVVLLVGDVFGVMPVIAKPVLDARYADRAHRLYTLDCVQTRAAGFAHRSFVVRPGQEPLVLLGLAAQLDAKLGGFAPARIAEVCGFPAEALIEAGAALKSAKRPVVIASLGSGRVADPKLLAGAIQVLSARLKGTRRLLAAEEAVAPVGLKSPAEIMTGIRNGQVKALLSFGDGFPFEYPAVRTMVANLPILVTMSAMRSRASASGWVLPVPLDLEKDGVVSTLWGDARLNRVADSVSGCRSVAEIVRLLTGAQPEPESIPQIADRLPVSVRNVTEAGRELLGIGLARPDPDFPFQLIAEKPAYDFQGLFSTDSGKVLIHPDDAAANRIGTGADVNLETARLGKTCFRVQTSRRVLPGTLLVNANEPQVSELFEIEYEPMSGLPVVPPKAVKLWPSA
jgi:hypothetical protein